MAAGDAHRQVSRFLVCSPEVLDSWCEALCAGDDNRRARCEAEVPAQARLENVTHTDVNLLAQLAAGGPVRVQVAAEDVEIVAALAHTGPWVMEFSAAAVRAIAAAAWDVELLRRWAYYADQFTEAGEDYHAAALTSETAAVLQNLCRSALARELALYTCYFG